AAPFADHGDELLPEVGAVSDVEGHPDPDPGRALAPHGRQRGQCAHDGHLLPLMLRTVVTQCDVCPPGWAAPPRSRCDHTSPPRSGTSAPPDGRRACDDGPMVNRTKIYTRTGDEGTTALGDFSRTRKTDTRLQSYADANEAN